MSEIPLSIVAWISVVLIQAVIHYFVIGRKRARMEAEEDLALEECLSLAESLSLADTSDDSVTFADLIVAQQETIVSPVRSRSNSSLIKEVLVNGAHDKHDESQEFLEFISHTGSELLKNRSVECLVEEQMRATTR